MIEIFNGHIVEVSEPAPEVKAVVDNKATIIADCGSVLLKPFIDFEYGNFMDTNMWPNSLRLGKAPMGIKIGAVDDRGIFRPQDELEISQCTVSGLYIGAGSYLVLRDLR